jgi:hypothetical protein
VAPWHAGAEFSFGSNNFSDFLGFSMVLGEPEEAIPGFWRDVTLSAQLRIKMVEAGSSRGCVTELEQQGLLATAKTVN